MPNMDENIKTLNDAEQYFYKYGDDKDALDELYNFLVDNQDSVEIESGDFKELLSELVKEIDKLDRDQEQGTGEDFTPDYDFSKYSLSMDPVESLNTENQPYPEFLRDVLIPTFNPVPYPDIQNPVLAVLCLINSSAIPPVSEYNAKEVLLPLGYIQGPTGSGKSQIANLIKRHYPPSRRGSVKESDTGATLIKVMDDVCYKSGSIDNGNLKLFPSVCILENFYHRCLTRWSSWSVELLSTERSYAVARRQGQDAGTFYTFCLKIFTSVEPLQAITQQNSEMIRRTIRIFTEKAVPKDTHGRYSWNYCKEAYKKIWNKEDTEERFFPLLQEVVSKADDETEIPPEFYPTSQLILATGVFTGIWQDLEEAEAHMAKYWKLVSKLENKMGKPYFETFDEKIKGYWREFRSCKDTGYPDEKADKVASECYLDVNAILQTAWERHGTVYSHREISEAMLNHFMKEGFQQVTEKRNGKTYFRRYY